MKVNHNDDLDTHAVIGGKNTRSFGMSDNSEFFSVLSDALYSNKPLAMVREVLSNAWDEHVKGGIQDTPVEVTIDDKRIVIRDHGPGIDDRVIDKIYCVYGNSTKVHDGNQNGGFGLGSKAPFAYTHHFTVTSYHKGTKTVYAISRGGPETDGKPDLRTVVSIPTTETGLEVSVPLKTPDDQFVLVDILQNLVLHGDMNVLLNGTETLDRLPMDSAPEGFTILPSGRRTAFSRNSIHIRYGTVVYPLQDIPEELQSLVRAVDIILDYDKLGKIIFQAEPNSIAVTPSRESLSMTDTTIKAIKKLMEDFLGRLTKIDRIWDFHKKLYSSYLKKVLSNKTTPDDILRLGKTEPYSEEDAEEVNPQILSNDSDYIQTSDDLVLLLLAKNNIEKILLNSNDLDKLNNERAIWNYQMAIRTMPEIYRPHFKAVARSTGYFQGNQNHENNFQKTHARESHWNASIMQTLRASFTKVYPGIKDRVTAPIKMGFVQRGYYGSKMKVESYETWVSQRKRTYFREDSALDPACVLVARNITSVSEFFKKHRNQDMCLCLTASRRKGAFEAALDIVSSSSPSLVPMDCREFEVVKERAPVKPRPKLSGFPDLWAFYNEKNSSFSVQALSDVTQRIEEPETFIFFNQKNYQRIIPQMQWMLHHGYAPLVREFLPKVGVLSNGDAVQNKLQELKLPTWQDLLSDRMDAFVKAHPEIFSMMRVRDDSDHGVYSMIKTLAQYRPGIGTPFPTISGTTPKKPTSTDNTISLMVQYLDNNMLYIRHEGVWPQMRDIISYARSERDKAHIANPDIKRLEQNPYLKFINLKGIVHAVQTKQKGWKEQLDLVEMVL